MLTQFAAFKSKYTSAFIDDALKAVDVAQQFEVISKRNANKKEIRTGLLDAAQVSLKNWKSLTRYISDAYPKAVVKDKLQAAGSDFYTKASKKNWSALGSLIQAGSDFIEQNFKKLVDDGHMPDTFNATFKTDGKACTDLIAGYLNINITNRDITTDKLEADNAIFEALNDMLKDAQECLSEKGQRQPRTLPFGSFINSLFLLSNAWMCRCANEMTQ